MSNNNSSTSGGGVGLLTVLFIVLKATGHWYITAWSWWWILLPIVPMVGLLLKKLGL